MIVRFGQPDDFRWLVDHEPHVDSEWVSRCLGHLEYMVATDAQDRIGFLRHSMFWGKIPYMDLIWVAISHRRQAVGTGLFRFWRHEMQRRGATLLLTSSMTDEPEPQNWHRRNGFKECGSLTFGKWQETPEIFFALDLRANLVTEPTVPPQ